MTRLRLTPALIAADVLLALVLAALWLAPGLPAHWRNWQTPVPQAPNLDDARAAQLTPNPALRRDYPEITARPLFAADRKPRASASDAQAAAAPPPESIDQVKLYGLVDGPAAQQGALLEQGGQPQFVRLGDKIGDWTLKAIEERQAIFIKGDERRAVPLPDSLSGATASPLPNAPAAAATPTHMPAPQPQPLAQPSQSAPAVSKAPRPAQPSASPSLSGSGGTTGAGAQAQPRPATPAAQGAGL